MAKLNQQFMIWRLADRCLSYKYLPKIQKIVLLFQEDTFVCSFFRRSSITSTLLGLGIAATTVSPILISAPVLAQDIAQVPAGGSNLTDISSGYWASPFIQALAERNVITGFPDNTYRPNQPVTRAEFAVLIQKAFNPSPVRQVSAGGFRDVPANYWAAAAIRQAYEGGFLSGYPGNVFRPNERISKVEALVALTSGLRLTGGDSNTLNTYYTDASAIPSYAVNNVATATQANLVVNYPNVQQLNPQASLTRAEAAAILYQALVRQGRVQPLASNVAASNYIVGRTATTPTGGDIVSLAASSGSFTTLTSLLQTAGLTNVLQQGGPYTVFAPTDQAFAALPPNTLQQLQQPENRETLIKILRYHVLPGQVTASQLTNGQVNTLEGAPINVKVDQAGNQILVNGARVIQANVQASNGVIHAVNEVLIPPTLTGQQPTPPTPATDVAPGRTTLGGPSYIGVGGNIGLTGTNALSVGNFSVISKIGLTRNISVRPAAIFGDNTLITVPVTLDFAPQTTAEAAGRTFPIAPFVGAGVAIDTTRDTDLAFMLTGGVDVPLGSRFTATGAVNAAFFNNTSVGLTLGVGYNF